MGGGALAAHGPRPGRRPRRARAGAAPLQAQPRGPHQPPPQTSLAGWWAWTRCLCSRSARSLGRCARRSSCQAGAAHGCSRDGRRCCCTGRSRVRSPSHSSSAGRLTRHPMTRSTAARPPGCFHWIPRAFGQRPRAAGPWQAAARERHPRQRSHPGAVRAPVPGPPTAPPGCTTPTAATAGTGAGPRAPACSTVGASTPPSIGSNHRACCALLAAGPQLVAAQGHLEQKMALCRSSKQWGTSYMGTLPALLEQELLVLRHNDPSSHESTRSRCK